MATAPAVPDDAADRRDIISEYLQGIDQKTVHEINSAANSVIDSIENGHLDEEMRIVLYDASARLTAGSRYPDDVDRYVRVLQDYNQGSASIPLEHLALILAVSEWNREPNRKTRNAIKKRLKSASNSPPTSAIYLVIRSVLDRDNERDRHYQSISELAAKKFALNTGEFLLEWADFEYVRINVKTARSGNSSLTKDMATLEAVFGNRLLQDSSHDKASLRMYEKIKATRKSMQNGFWFYTRPTDLTAPRRGGHRGNVASDFISEIFNKYDYDPDAVQALLGEYL